MKYLLVILLILVVFWLWRSGRPGPKKAAPPRRTQSKSSEKKEITEMVACGFCHVHLAKSEALIGRDGFYCSEAHRREAGA
ncbi:PP0621 family protein [Polaromonas sp. CG_9.11]|uniref:PP0621 family protein n=1 Tax=Polaromonas sp. CG_9.11 TaxID=2787730 RepID=UPI0018CA7D83|nr:PP0621 family protein [Polaromonas sp. CG_9.11]MBG6074807.1 uncharacterized protein [Polaromonas sp. CG_9.11]